MNSPQRAALASLVFGHTAEHGLATFCPADGIAGPAHAARNAKLAALRDPTLTMYADEFWPDPPRAEYFQPEPGCSEPTFTGSATEVAALTGRMLRYVAGEFGSSSSTSSAFYTALVERGCRGADSARVEFRDDLVLEDPFGGYQVRVAPSAVAELRAWTRRSERVAPGSETGGVLFGERDDALHIIWVTDILGPPPDSKASPAGFICGIEGVEGAARFFNRRARGSSGPVGMWHTHPGGPATPSPTDRGGMAQLVYDHEHPLPKQLLLIIGGDPDSHHMAAYTYDSSKTPPEAYDVEVAPLPASQRPAHRIGLALSGGGFRAVAFHLGVLRALHDRGVLELVDVVSSVSGGSIIAAMWAYSDDTFEDFDRRVVALLQEGLMGKIARRTLLSRRTLQGAASASLAAFGSAAASAARLAGRRDAAPLFRRRVNRTSAVIDVFARTLFGTRKITDVKRDVAVVINAAELRSGNAFRFGNTESGSSRYGRLRTNDVPLATAVGASAAYPVALPAIDTVYDFVGFNGQRRSERVLLTDGGVYDNLGLTALEPGRDPRFSTNVHPVDFIVSADAGQGVLEMDRWPLWWPSRMKRSFESVYRKVQDAGKGLLHEHSEAGKLEGFTLALLGMQDRALPLRPPDLVPRDAVIGYPTDFAAMSHDNLSLLSLRGEQLVRLTIEAHCHGIV
jgi:NTE family protein